jgi:hypothetical protein
MAMSSLHAILALTQSQQLLLFAGVLAIMMLLTISMRRRTQQRMQLPTTRARERLEELTAQRNVRDEMEQLLGELQDLSRKINAQIDTKFAKLETAIRDADERIAELRRLSGVSPDDAGDQASPPPAGHERLSVVLGEDAEPDATDAASRTEHARVYAMADAGQSAVEIAQSLGRPTGEIELILSLRPKQ